MKVANVPVPVNVTYLGGFDQIDRNCAAIESEDQLLLLDCGLSSSDFDALGTDLALSNFDHVRRSKLIVSRVAAIKCVRASIRRKPMLVPIVIEL